MHALKSATHSLTKVFPIFQNKIGDGRTIILSPHRPTILFWRLSNFTSWHLQKRAVHTWRYQLLGGIGQKLRLNCWCTLVKKVNQGGGIFQKIRKKWWCQIWMTKTCQRGPATNSIVYCKYTNLIYYFNQICPAENFIVLVYKYQILHHFFSFLICMQIMPW